MIPSIASHPATQNPTDHRQLHTCAWSQHGSVGKRSAPIVVYRSRDPDRQPSTRQRRRAHTHCGNQGMPLTTPTAAADAQSTAAAGQSTADTDPTVDDDHILSALTAANAK